MSHADATHPIAATRPPGQEGFLRTTDKLRTAKETRDDPADIVSLEIQLTVG
jgi:hypothetical protein